MNQENKTQGIKWVNYAKAFSIFVAAVLSIVSLFKSFNNEAITKAQKIQIDNSANKILDLEQKLSSISKNVSERLTFGNIVAGDTINSTAPTFYGHLDIDIPEDYKLYGAIKTENEYSFMSTPIDVEANGNWEYKFSIGSGLGKINILLVLCENEAHQRLSAQIQQGNWKVNSISGFGGMKSVGSVEAYVN